ncbi:MAG: MoaD/ThiS family protein [Anaerolineae bacterium]
MTLRNPVLIHIPTPLRSYTSGQAHVQAEGATLGELLADLDRQYPGIRFRMIDEQDRIRTHILIFVNKSRAEGLSSRLGSSDEIRIIPAISGGACATSKMGEDEWQPTSLCHN